MYTRDKTIWSFVWPKRGKAIISDPFPPFGYTFLVPRPFGFFSTIWDIDPRCHSKDGIKRGHAGFWLAQETLR